MKRKVLSVIMTGAMVAGLAGTVPYTLKNSRHTISVSASWFSMKHLTPQLKASRMQSKRVSARRTLHLMSRMHRAIPLPAAPSSTTSYPAM